MAARRAVLVAGAVPQTTAGVPVPATSAPIPLPAGTADRPRFFIAIPAWGKDYVATAVRFTVPGILASLHAARRAATFLIYTDRPADFAGLLEVAAEHSVVYINTIALPTYHHPPKNPHPREYWAAFMAAHLDALRRVPRDAIACMWNADIVPSVECFGAVERIFGDPRKKLIAMLGIRTLLDGNSCPIGVNAPVLNRWSWDHLHPISRDHIFGIGASVSAPVLIFASSAPRAGGESFRRPDGIIPEDPPPSESRDPDVSMHSLHLTPMFIRIDRVLAPKGTIDDDLMERYVDDEIAYLNDGSVAFAELSFAWKKHGSGALLSVDSFTAGGKRKISKPHLRNLAVPFRFLGNSTKNQAIDEILRRVS